MSLDRQKQIIEMSRNLLALFDKQRELLKGGQALPDSESEAEKLRNLNDEIRQKLTEEIEELRTLIGEKRGSASAGQDG